MTQRLRRRTLRLALVALCMAMSPLLSAQQTTVADQTSDSTDAEVNVAAGDAQNVTVTPVRNFGYVIGDVLMQSISLSQSYTPKDLAPLSGSSRISTWLERQAAIMQSLDDGSHTLTLRYQIINAPPSIISTALPQLTLTPASGEPVTVSAWPFTLGPLTALVPQSESAATDGSLQVVDGNPLKADMSLPFLDEITPATHLQQALLLLALTLASWIGWTLWRNHHDKVRLPFAHALQSLGSRKQRKQGDIDAAWTVLHHAFNQSAGEVVNTSSIDRLLETHAWLRPLEPRIHSFYAASAARHYALPARDESFAVDELARVLAASERRNSR